MNNPIAKEHSPAYKYLEPIATRLAADYNKAVNAKHSEETIGSVQRDCIRTWDSAVRHVVSPNGLAAKPGQVNAARRRLNYLSLLTFLRASRAQTSNAA